MTVGDVLLALGRGVLLLAGAAVLLVLAALWLVGAIVTGTARLIAR